MTDIPPIPCHVCGEPAVWSDVRRRWRCASNHLTSEVWAASHALGPYEVPASAAAPSSDAAEISP